jgi:nucleoside phosphorylase
MNAVYGGNDYYWLDSASGYRCVAASSGRMGPGESARIAERLLALNPATIVNIGIAASLHTDVRIGDVVVPDLVLAYDKTGKAIDGGDDADSWEWQRRGDAFRPTYDLVETARELITAYPEQYEAWQAPGAQEFATLRQANLDAFQEIMKLQPRSLRERPEIRVVYLASGNFVSASNAFVEWLRQGNADLKALEMEAAGMLLAAEKRATRTKTLVIRGISDHVAAPKSQTDAIAEGALRGLAMRNALRLLQTLLTMGAFPRHPRGPNAAASTEAALHEGPNEMPAAAVKDFTGRLRPLALLEKHLLEHATMCVVVAGPGGLGKTTLVQQFVATRGRVCFPDGAAWLDGRSRLSCGASRSHVSIFDSVFRGSPVPATGNSAC